ncbi:TRAP transporter small permease [Sulfitobacter faviae]|uniref:TRAP transporter small permease n=1 Tax=Sulfitobacter faviae TaxID=1775881 RepID=UPI0024582C3E|nr:TRAP transporter small permease subunit [Sulfitobacter faviae]
MGQHSDGVYRPRRSNRYIRLAGLWPLCFERHANLGRAACLASDLLHCIFGRCRGVRDNTHLGVTLFRDVMPIPVQKVIMMAIDFILAAFGGVMFYAGTQLMIFGWDSNLPMLEIPESFRTLAITLCGALIVLHAGTRGIIRILTYSDWHPQFETQES